MKSSLYLIVPIAIAAACSAGGGGPKIQGGQGGSSGGGNGGVPGIDAGGGSGAAGGSITPTCNADCLDFPEQPIFETGAPTNAPDLFGPVNPGSFSGTAPCVLEPQLSGPSSPGAMLPPNWLAPRFRFAASGNLFEIRVSTEVQRHDLVVYTTTPEWVMPRDTWVKAASNNGGKPMTVTIRALDSASPATQSGVQGDIQIAPVNAGGSLVFWTVKDSTPGPDSSKLFGFTVGDEGVAEVLAPKTVEFDGIIHELGVDLRGDFGGLKPGFSAGEVQCIGCHTSTPDGKAVIFTDDWPWNKGIASIEQASQGATPAYLSSGARALLKMPWLGTQTTSASHWQDGNRVMVASWGNRTAPFSSSPTGCSNGQVTCSGQSDRLIWINLETDAPISDVVPPLDSGQRQQAAAARNAAIQAAQGSAWDLIATNGETASAVMPDWNDSGDTIAYVSTDKSADGHPDYAATRADIMLVPFSGGSGGTVTPLAGASDPGVLEFYPAFSADGKVIAFTRAPAKGATSGCPGTSCPDGPYYNRFGEIHILPSGGGTSVRLSANDPVACAGDDLTRGLLNSWPKWSPRAASINGKTYYFVIFSSARKYPGSFEIPRGQYTPPTLDTRSSQLYMAAIVIDDATNQVSTYSAVYLWNQNRVVAGDAITDVQNSNLTPAWDDFVIPPVEVPK